MQTPVPPSPGKARATNSVLGKTTEVPPTCQIHYKSVLTWGQTESTHASDAQDVTSLYDLGKVLGRGQFGTTRMAVEKSTGKTYACKSISKRKLTCAAT